MEATLGGPGGPIHSDTKDTNPKDAAATTRISLSVFPASARAYGALGMTEGDLKYGAFNYRVAGVLASVYYDAVGRHMDKWFFCGEDVDPKTLVPHLANAIASLAVLIDSIEQGNLNDDRPPRQPVGLYDRLEGNVAHLQKTFPRRVPRYTQKALDDAARGLHSGGGGRAQQAAPQPTWPVSQRFVPRGDVGP